MLTAQQLFGKHPIWKIAQNTPGSANHGLGGADHAHNVSTVQDVRLSQPRPIRSIHTIQHPLAEVGMDPKSKLLQSRLLPYETSVRQTVPRMISPRTRIPNWLNHDQDQQPKASR